MFLSRNYVSERDVKDENGRSALIWAAAQNADDVVNIMAANAVNLVDGDPNKITGILFVSYLLRLTIFLGPTQDIF